MTDLGSEQFTGKEKKAYEARKIVERGGRVGDGGLLNGFVLIWPCCVVVGYLHPPPCTIEDQQSNVVCLCQRCSCCCWLYCSCHLCGWVLFLVRHELRIKVGSLLISLFCGLRCEVLRSHHVGERRSMLPVVDKSTPDHTIHSARAF